MLGCEFGNPKPLCVSGPSSQAVLQWVLLVEAFAKPEGVLGGGSPAMSAQIPMPQMSDTLQFVAGLGDGLLGNTTN